MKTSKVRQLTVLAFLVALASALHVIESWFPLLFSVPGAKLGLANIVSLFAMVTFGIRTAFYIVIARILIGSIFASSLFGPGFFISAGAALISLGVMYYLEKYFQPFFSLCGISIAGAATHNIAQVTIAAALVSNFSLMWYAPYLIFFAVPTGVFTGIIVIYLLQRMPEQIIN